MDSFICVATSETIFSVAVKREQYRGSSAIYLNKITSMCLPGTRDEVLISSAGSYDLLETESHVPYENQPESEFGESHAYRKQFQAKKC